MSETKWTPGPWKAIHIDDDFDDCWAVAMGSYLENPNHYLMADFWSCEANDNRAEGNACLIAAAPEMATAIQMLIDSLEGKDVDPEEAIGACRASLAKARGEGKEAP